MIDKLDVFIESQRETNESQRETNRLTAQAISDLEKLAAEYGSFIRDAKWVLRSAVLVFILASVGEVWKATQPDNTITKADMQELIAALAIIK